MKNFLLGVSFFYPNSLYLQMGKNFNISFLAYDIMIQYGRGD